MRTSNRNTFQVHSCNGRQHLLPVNCSALRRPTNCRLSSYTNMSQPVSSQAAAVTAASAAQQRPWWQRPFLGLAGARQHSQQRTMGKGVLEALFASKSDPAVVQSGTCTAGPTHLIVMVNGLFGSSGNWDVISEQLQQHLDPQQTLLHPSTANSRFATYDGIDTCGTRLAGEIRAVVAAAPQLQRISILAHSMGGLMARYAIGALYNPASCTICGLQPAHFVTMATPHFGCDADGPAQVPFIGWTNEVPLLGQQLFSFLQDISAPTAALIFRRTGQQFFMLDGKQQREGRGGTTSSSSSSTADLPVLLQLTQDCKDRGLYFYSALAAFKTRTCYANTGSDHLVGFANSSIRSLSQLPSLPPAASTAKGVVLEDPISAAFFPQTWQQLQHQWQQQQQRSDVCTAPAPAAASAAASTLQATIGAAYQPSQLQWERQQVGAAAQQGSSAASGQPAIWHQISNTDNSKSGRLPVSGNWVPVPKDQQQQQQQGATTVAVLELAASGAAAAATEAVADLLTHRNNTPAAAAQAVAQQPSSTLQQQQQQWQGRSSAVLGLEASGAAAAATEAVADLLSSPADISVSDANQLASNTSAANSTDDDLMQLDSSSFLPISGQAAPAAAAVAQQRNDNSSSSNGAAIPAAAAAAAEQDLASGLAGAGTAAAASGESAVDAVAADVAQLVETAGASSRADMVAHMLHRMQELPWRRVDVSFQGARFGFAHNNIQVTRRWLNFEGVAVPTHLAQQVQLMDALVMASEGDSDQQQQQKQQQQARCEIAANAPAASVRGLAGEGVPVDATPI